MIGYVFGAVICFFILLKLSKGYAESDNRTASYGVAFVCVFLSLFWPVVLPTIIGAFILLPGKK